MQHFSSNFSAPFIRRPVATSLITFAILLSGVVAFQFLPVAPLPQVDFPTISVGAGLPGASPETMASAVATPLERQFGRIAGVTQMTSTSSLGQSGITLQFDLNRNIDADGRDVQAAINAARGQLPPNLPSNPGWRKVNPADAPVMIIATNDQLFKAEQYQNLIVTSRSGIPVFLHELADVRDSVENTQNAGLANGKPAVLLVIFRQPGTNIIGAVDRVRALLPQLQAS